MIFFLSILSLLLKKDFTEIGTMNGGMTGSAIAGVGIETAVPAWSGGVAAKT
jgi:hypothetical protein